MAMPKKQGDAIFWAPRGMAIAFILFMSLFSLDVFGEGYGFWGTALALLMHNIPSLVLLAVLVASWKHGIVGGIAFIFAGLLYMAVLAWSMMKDHQFQWHSLTWSLGIAGPAFLVGILFLADWKRGRKNK